MLDIIKVSDFNNIKCYIRGDQVIINLRIKVHIDY